MHHPLKLYMNEIDMLVDRILGSRAFLGAVTGAVTPVCASGEAARAVSSAARNRGLKVGKSMSLMPLGASRNGACAWRGRVFEEWPDMMHFETLRTDRTHFQGLRPHITIARMYGKGKGQE